MKRLHIVLVVGIISMIAAGMYLYLQHSPPLTLQAPAKELGNTDRSLIVKGMVVPVRYAVLTLPAGGVIAEAPVRTGEQVAAGQLLLRLESHDIGKRLQQAQADQARAEAILEWVRQNRVEEIASKQTYLAAAQAELNRAQADWQRIRQLYDAGAVSEQQLDQSHTVYLQRKADARSAQSLVVTAPISNSIDTILTARQAEVESARAYVEQMQSLARQNELYAPFGGTVALLNARVGEYTAAAAPVVYLGDCSAWQIYTEDVTESKVGRIRQGAAVLVTFTALPGLEIPGRVISVSAYGEKKAEAMIYQAIIELDRQDARLRWNMTANIELVSE